MKHGKRLCLLSLALVLCCAVGLLPAAPLPVRAAAIVDGGYCGRDADGTNVRWTLDAAGTLTLSGKGEMESYFTVGGMDLDLPWGRNGESNLRRVKAAVIEDGVTTVGANAFNGCRAGSRSSAAARSAAARR